MKRIVICVLIGLGFTSWCLAQNQPTSENGIFRQEGVASWYGPGFEGRNTASGEIFDSAKFTAAHPTLPFGTILTVTNLQNNKQVIVRVNDRGPFTSSRIIDISKAAADQIDMTGPGTIPVLIETRGPVAQNQTASAPTNPSAAPTSTPPQQSVSATAAQIRPGIPPVGTNKSYRIQVGAFQVMRNATNVFEKLKNAGFNPSYEHHGNIYRIVLAGIRAEEVPAIAERLGNAGFQEALIREEP